MVRVGEAPKNVHSVTALSATAKEVDDFLAENEENEEKEAPNVEEKPKKRGRPKKNTAPAPLLDDLDMQKDPKQLVEDIAELVLMQNYPLKTVKLIAAYFPKVLRHGWKRRNRRIRD